MMNILIFMILTANASCYKKDSNSSDNSLLNEFDYDKNSIFSAILKGANVNGQYIILQTPLHLSVSKGRDEITKLFSKKRNECRYPRL